MLEHAKDRLHELQGHMQTVGLDIALLTDESTIAYTQAFGVTFLWNLGARPF